MKKTLTTLFVVTSLAFPAIGHAQTNTNSQTTLSPKWAQLQSTDGITASYLESTSNGHKYMVLQLHNETQTPITFSWSLKDSKNNIAAESKSFTLSPEMSISGLDDATLNGGNMMILLPEGQSAKTFSLTLHKIN